MARTSRAEVGSRPSRGLVEKEHRGDRSPARAPRAGAASCRWSRSSPCGRRRRQADALEKLVRQPGGAPYSLAKSSRFSRPAEPLVEVLLLEDEVDERLHAPRARATTSWPAISARRRLSAARAPSACGWSSSCRRRCGPGSRGSRPRATVKLMSSTARTLAVVLGEVFDLDDGWTAARHDHIPNQFIRRQKAYKCGWAMDRAWAASAGRRRGPCGACDTRERR